MCLRYSTNYSNDRSFNVMDITKRDTLSKRLVILDGLSRFLTKLASQYEMLSLTYFNVFCFDDFVEEDVSDVSVVDLYLYADNKLAIAPLVPEIETYMYDIGLDVNIVEYSGSGPSREDYYILSTYGWSYREKISPKFKDYYLTAMRFEHAATNNVIDYSKISQKFGTKEM